MNQSRLLYLIIAGISIFAAAYIVMKYVLVKKDKPNVEVAPIKDEMTLEKNYFSNAIDLSGNDGGNDGGKLSSIFDEDDDEYDNDNFSVGGDNDDDNDDDDDENDENDDDNEQEEEEIHQKNNLSNYLPATLISPSSEPMEAPIPQSPVQPPSLYAQPNPPPTHASSASSEPLPIGDERFPELNDLCFPAIATPGIPYHSNPTSMYSMFSNKADTSLPSIYNIV